MLYSTSRTHERLRRSERPAMRSLPSRSTQYKTICAREVRLRAEQIIVAATTRKESGKNRPQEIVDKANRPAVEGFRCRCPTRPATRHRTEARNGAQASAFEDLVQYNDGFRTRSVGTPNRSRNTLAYRRRGSNSFVGFLHFQEEIDYFGSRVCRFRKSGFRTNHRFDCAVSASS